MKRLSISILTGLFLGIAGALIADRFLHQRIPVIGNFAGLQYSLNPGIAFGIQLPTVLQSILIAVALLFVTFFAFKKGHSALAQWGFGLIIGGGFANVIDRLFDGYVTDFFQVGTFPIFNTADSCVTIGVLLLLIDVFLLEKRLRKER